MPKDSVIPEFLFSHGRLEITEPHCSTWIRGWPGPAAQRRLAHDKWRDFRPAFRLLAPAAPAARDLAYKPEACDSMEDLTPDQAASKQSAYHAFRQTLPADFALLLEAFTGHQWNLIQLLHERPAFADLVRANPVLAWCVANNDQFFKLAALSPAIQARWQIHKKQRDLLEWLGFPRSEALVKVLKKIRPEAVSGLGLKLLHQAARERTASLEQFAQLEHINHGALYLVCNPLTTAHISHAVVRAVAGQADELSDSPVAALLSDTVMLWGRLRRGQPAPVFHSIRAMTELHDELLADFHRPPPVAPRRRAVVKAPVKPKPDTVFPPPPLPGTASIMPICSKEELTREGRNQHNCVAVYAASVVLREIYFYKVLKPCRATLSLKRGPGGEWSLNELRAAYNKPVKPGTLAQIRSWYSLARGGC